MLTEDPAMTHKLTILALDAVVPLDLAIAAQLMGYPAAPYDVTICGPRPGQVTTTSGFAAAVSHGLRALAAANTVMIPGFSPHNRALPPPVLEGLRRAYQRGARMVSICTGAFALAQAGILDGRRAATHWRHAGELATSFPAVTVDPDVLYVDQGQVLTSAGVAAGIDLCLHLIRADHGARAANAVARQVVIAPYRDGGQAQYIRQPVPAARPARRWRPPGPGRRTVLPRPWRCATSRATPTCPSGPSPAGSSPKPAPRRCAGWPPSA